MSDPFAPFTPYDDALAQTILRAIGRGLSLSEACAHDGMPQAGDVLEWADSDPDFAARLHAARDRSAELKLESLAHRCENPPEELKPRTLAEHFSHVRLTLSVTRLVLQLRDPKGLGRIRKPGPPGEAYARRHEQRSIGLADALGSQIGAFHTACASFDGARQVTGLLADIAFGAQEGAYETACSTMEAARKVTGLLAATAKDEGLMADEVPDPPRAPRLADLVPGLARTMPPPRPTRRERRAMAAMARKQPATDGAAKSRPATSTAKPSPRAPPPSAAPPRP